MSGTDSTWTSSPNATFDPKSESSLNITIPTLRSSTSYDYRFVATYTGKYSYSEKENTFTEQFFQPTQQGRTKAGTPSAPISVEITKERAFWILKWQQPENDGGAPIVSYAVEYRL
uniref:Fibronectin type-III domain-containing protein n=1 Tax=Panagrolaimus sp. PS1159 TaxID=55785 RepID=A0AC35FY27_9BILA